MPDAKFVFPKDFIWGTATSSHQVEGGNTNNQWHQWEQEGHILEGHVSGLACDWWGGRWKEDFDRAAEGGQASHRMSIEWSRVQPEPGRWDESALDCYRQMVVGMQERGLSPVVALHHFSDPLWLTEMGGWENDEVVGLFETYTEKVISALKAFVKDWITINEPNVYAVLGYLFGDFPPGKQDLQATMKVMENLARGHAAAYHKIKELQPESQVGFALNWRGFNPARPNNPLDKYAAKTFFRIYNDFFPQAFTTGKMRFITRTITAPELANTQDYIGINYYTSDRVRFSLGAAKDLFVVRDYPPEVELSGTGYNASMPGEFFKAIKWAEKFGLPIIITENGTETLEDDHRRRYMIEHILQVWRAVNFNIPVKGYYLWSLVDNFEWERGWTQRFGIWELDIETQARKKRPSADLYTAICEENALTSKMVREYAPELVEKLLPG